MATHDEDARPTRLFTDWLAEHRNGLADADLAAALRDLAEACALTGKSGSLAFTIKITPQGDMLAVNDTLTVKIPEIREARLYWVNLAGDLTRNNPMQPEIPFETKESKA
jgi:hypothetical protein